MLYLAQIQKKDASTQGELRLLARQRSEYAWSVVTEREYLPVEGIEGSEAGSLVLIELSDTYQVLSLDSANDWILDIIQTFLVNGITPAFLQEESERAEQWRQSLTLQSQDLDRRALELEARREQIEQLEESLKREKKQMELLALQYKEQSQELDRRALDLETRREQIEQLERTLNEEKQRIEEMVVQNEIKAKTST